MSAALDAECEVAGLDPKVVARIAGRLERAAKDAEKLGLVIFGGSGSGSLRWRDPQEGHAGRALIVGEMDGSNNWDGGDGGYGPGPDGLNRGE